MSDELRTSTTHTFATEPPEQGGREQTVVIDLDKFTPPVKRTGKKRTRPTKFLLIGFDTEYQTTAPVLVQQVRKQEVEAKNEVLSYQYCVKLVSRNDGADEKPKEVSGIIIPEEGERISFQDFIAMAVGAFMNAFPSEMVPVEVYLVGHFTRADIPGLSEFQATARLMSSIRSTLISLDNGISVHIDDGADRSVVLTVKVRDTLLLAPSSAKSVSQLGQIVDFEKIRLHKDREREVKIKNNMKDLRRRKWKLFRRYAIRDAEVCIRYADRILRQHDELFQRYELPVTLTGFGTELVFNMWDYSKWDPYEILGREQVDEKKFNKRKGYFHKFKVTPFQEDVHLFEALAVESYHGGRNEQFMFGAADEADWRDVDLSSAYTTAMSIIGFPDWRKLEMLSDLESIKIDDLAFASVDFEFPPSVRFPTMPVRTANGIVFPRRGSTICAGPEIWLALRLGATLKLNRGVRIPMDRTRPVFRDFICDAIKNRSKYPKGSFDNLFWKEVGNSTYGKTAQGLRKKRVYDLRDDQMVELPPSKLTQPFFASFITSYTRAVLGEIMNALPNRALVFSVTTDGFLTTATDIELRKALAGPLAQTFQKARESLDGAGKAQALETKHRIRRPIGWRTRGSATLSPGDGPSDNIVLQKGGIRTNELYEIEQQNSHIVRLFLNRTPDKKIAYDIGIGIKDMVRYDTDFVYRRVVKHLGMEFDWKRRPINVREETFEFEGELYTHLSFDSEPLEDVNEFRCYRDAWDEIIKKKRKICLKTTDDLKLFFEYLSTRKLPRSVRTYLRDKDGDLDRLSRDLCRAYKHQQAGFDLIIADWKKRRKTLTHERFIGLLTGMGLPCNVHKLDYAKRKPFIPGHCITSERARDVLERLRSEHFPQLKIEAFFASGESESGNVGGPSPI